MQIYDGGLREMTEEELAELKESEQEGSAEETLARIESKLNELKKMLSGFAFMIQQMDGETDENN